MSANHANQDKGMFLRVAVALVFLLGAVLLCASSSEVIADDDSQGTQWVNQLVTAQKNISPSQILGPWYTVEQVRNFSFLPQGLCEKFEFLLNYDNISYAVNYTLSMGPDSFILPQLPVISDATWVIPSLSVGFKLLDISADGGFLALGSCDRYVNSCYGVLLGRDPDLSGREDDLLAMHRSLERAGLNDTRVGHRQRPDVCRPGASVEGYQPAKQYDV